MLNSEAESRGMEDRASSEPDWVSVQWVFEAVIDLPEPERLDAIGRLCKGNEAMQQAVGEMLDADAAECVLDSPIEQLADTMLSGDAVRSLFERQIGQYRLIRVLGEGGMGVVYLAERTNIGGLVAIKLLRDAWMSPMRRGLFAQEQQILAQLNHPNIARIYDAGAMEDRTPWFVMEYVDGFPIDEWCVRGGASLAETLTLFEQVCEAVAHAHRVALMHRDLKPSNILVTELGQVKLLDFGIAKSLDGESGDLKTTIGLRMMTPAYAAPEQRRGEITGLYTDVYALGVLLHELLTGRSPQVLREGETLRPSQVAGAVAGQCRFLLSRGEWKDLDVLCGKAMQASPDQRYGSVDNLLRDVRAFLEGRALEARSLSILYRAGKFVRRNRALLTTGAVAAMLLLVMLVVSAVRVTRSKNDAVRELKRSERLREFTESLFDGGNVREGPSLNLTTEDMLRRGEVKAEGLRDDPRLQADMFATIGTVYQQMGRYDRADSLLQRAMRERREHFGERDKEYAGSLVEIGLLRKDQGKIADAESLLHQAVELGAKQLPARDPVRGHALWALGSVLALHGKYAEAKRVLEEAVDVDEGSGDGTQLADDLVQLADVEFYLDRLDRAGKLNHRALGIYRERLGQNDPVVGRVLNSLGQIALNQNRLDEAEDSFRQGLALHERWYGPEHAEVAFDLASLAKIAQLRKQADVAHNLLTRALAIQVKAYGHDHPRVALTLNDLGVLDFVYSRGDDGEGYFRDALAIWRKTYGDDHSSVGLCYANLAGVFMDRKDYPAAETMAKQAMSVYRRTLPDDHVELAILHVKLGRILLRQGRYSEAEQETRTGYLYFSTHETPDKSYLDGARRDLTAIEMQLHKPALEPFR